MWPPELETLDQLQGDDLPLTVIATLYSSPEAFRKGVLGLLVCGDVLLLDAEDNAVPKWRWREIFAPSSEIEQLGHFRLRLTSQGAKRIG
jgi:dihydroxyacid dehydratase/phosphogluconate dehydratase